MTIEVLLGVDGGGTSTRVLLARPAGPVLGQGSAGPSALGQGVHQAWRHVEQAVQRACLAAGLAFPGWRRCAMAAGLSGVSHPPWKDAFAAADPGLGLLVAETDSFAMLVGAHGGRRGAIVAAGTGSIAEAWCHDGSRRTVGGWGFPSGDEGSGAWIGLQAVRHAQAALDGRENAGPLARQVWLHCGDERDALQHWSAQAGQHAFAQLAPAVFAHAGADPAAAAILHGATDALATMALAIDPAGRLPLAFCGSIGERLAPRMPPALRSRMVAPAEGPTAGALTLVRQAVQQEHGTEAVA